MANYKIFVKLGNRKTSSIIEYIELIDDGFKPKIPLKNSDGEGNNMKS